ncbi:MAG: DsrE family protein [Chthonomonadales bacterium]
MNRTANFSWALAIVGAIAIGMMAAGSSLVRAEVAKKHQVVFEVNVDGIETWQSIMNNVENLQKEDSVKGIKIELVCHGKGLSMLLTKEAALVDRLKAASDKGVILAACENTMRRKMVKKEDLPTFTTTVPSGVTEVVLKQEGGWSYIKAGY